MNSPKVLFVSRKYPPIKGGMESYSYNLITNYTGNHHAITLGKRQIHLLWFLPYCLIYVLFNHKKYDVIQLGDMLLCSVGWLAKKINPSIKVVATVHGLDITYPNPLYRFYLKLFSKGLDCYVPNSTYTMEIASKQGYSPCVVITPATLQTNASQTLPCSEQFFYQKHNLPNNALIISTVGRLVKRKGVEWFIRNVLPSLEHLNIVYLVVGCGEMEKEIINSISDTHTNKVRLLGRITEQELADVYAHSDIFLMPNIYVENDVEGYGMVAVEAAAAECLVIAANMQGITDAVKDNVSGLLYEPENIDLLRNLLLDVIAQYDNYKPLIQSAKKYVLAECTGVAIANKYKDLMSRL